MAKLTGVHKNTLQNNNNKNLENNYGTTTLGSWQLIHQSGNFTVSRSATHLSTTRENALNLCGSACTSVSSYTEMTGSGRSRLRWNRRKDQEVRSHSPLWLCRYGPPQTETWPIVASLLSTWKRQRVTSQWKLAASLIDCCEKSGKTYS